MKEIAEAGVAAISALYGSTLCTCQQKSHLAHFYDKASLQQQKKKKGDWSCCVIYTR